MKRLLKVLIGHFLKIVESSCCLRTEEKNKREGKEKKENKSERKKGKGIEKRGGEEERREENVK